MKNTILIICAIFALNISHTFVASKLTQSDNDTYDYYDDYDGSTTTETVTEAPTTTTTTPKPRTSYRRTTRPAGVVYYSKPFRFSSSTTTNQYELPPRTRATTTQSSAGINRNAIDLERSENRKDYAQSRVAEDSETDEEKFLSRRYARFLFLQRVG
jgi:hypothetical protein